MLTINAQNTRTWAENETLRSMFGKAVTALAKQNPDIVLLVADSGRMCKAENTFAKELPGQYLECGISEQNMIGVASGLAQAGKKPVAFAFSPFATQRCLEQIRLDVAYAGLDIVIVGADAGIAQATLGVTHYGWEDAGVVRVIPGMTILCPADHAALIKCLEAALARRGPCYIRLTGGGGKPKVVYESDFDFEIGKAVDITAGSDAQLFACGTMLTGALRTAALLRDRGIGVGVTDMCTIKPVDAQSVRTWANKVPLLVSVEEHNRTGGLGTAIAEELAETAHACRLLRIGLPDAYPKQVSTYPVMMEDFGLTPRRMADAIAAVLRS